MNILLSLYACEPNRGSEPGVGWGWALNTLKIKEHNFYVLTRENNRIAIEKFFLGGTDNSPKFIFYDLPDFFLKFKGKLFSKRIYYVLWQIFSFLFIIRNQKKYNIDIIHHVTFCSFRYSGFWFLSHIPYVLGPIGGISVANKSHMALFSGIGKVVELARSFVIKKINTNFIVRKNLCMAKKLLFVGSDYKKIKFLKEKSNITEMLDISVLDEDFYGKFASGNSQSRKNFLFVGTIDPWKGWQIAVKAYFLFKNKNPNFCEKFYICGVGGESEKLKSMIKGRADIVYLGKIEQDKVFSLMKQSRALIFSSVRETAGSAVLEALANGCPIINFNHQGVGMITDETCALRYEPSGNLQLDICNFSKAVELLAKDDVLVKKLSNNARVRVQDNFLWSRKILTIKDIYNSI